MKISYAIPVCNESIEIARLLKFLFEYKRDEDEIVIQCDKGNTTNEVYWVLEEFAHLPNITITEFSLKGDFASFKNNLKSKCSGEWIFQIDADEIPHQNLMDNLPEVLQNNPYTDLLLVPRVNTVEGLTTNHIQEWGWRVDQNGWVNFPDYQTRIIQNSPKIAWGGKVHEVVMGHSQYGMLPQEEEWSLYHHKHIKRQEMQNKFYNEL